MSIFAARHWLFSRLRGVAVVAAFAAFGAPLANGCFIDHTHGSCSVPTGGARCDGNVLVTCGNRCDDSGCDNITIFDVRTDCGDFATCSTEGACNPKGTCSVDKDCCAPMPGGGVDCALGGRCKQGRCTSFLAAGAACDQDPNGCAPGLRCLPPAGDADAAVSEGGSDAGAADASLPDAAPDASGADAGAGLVCRASP